MAENKNKVVYGIYPGRQSVELAIEELKAEGFRAADVSALLPNPETSKEFAMENQTKAPEGATTGATSGALIGGTLGWLAGIGSVAIPGLGAFIAAGPLMGLLAGIGVGSVVGGLTGALIGMGIPEYEASRYEGRVKEGGILLSVHCDDAPWVDKAKKILKRTGAQDISSSGESSADFGSDEKPTLIANYTN